ncbi:MAG: YkgJ family cysteine cluster protein [Desulfarculus sp.]|nr:MAG: YkgJ family cysteine cluster protein [Desulfarculus sp.]
MPPTESLTERLARALAAGPSIATQAAAAALAGLRGCDAPGAAAVVARDDELCRLLAAGFGQEAALAARLAELAGAARCLGCGACCRVSSPTLYQEDLALLGPQGPGREHFYTLRAGEEVHSARLGRRQVLEQELIKLCEAPGGACVFLGPGGCAIYDQRPLQCRWLECWSGRHAGQLSGRPRLTRTQAFAGDHTARALAAEFERKLPAARLAGLLAAAAGGDDQAAEEALAVLEQDHGLRAAIGGRYGYGAAELKLLLGRPATAIARAYGLAVELDPDDRPRLRRMT